MRTYKDIENNGYIVNYYGSYYAFNNEWKLISRYIDRSTIWISGTYYGIIDYWERLEMFSFTDGKIDDGFPFVFNKVDIINLDSDSIINQIKETFDK